MEKYNKDTLANLISCELHRLNGIWRKCTESGDIRAAEYWKKEIEDLERLDNVIWRELQTDGPPRGRYREAVTLTEI
jgi:hypothetical protein